MFVALLLALAAETAPIPAQPAAEAAAAKPEASEVVCRTEQVTGSRFPKKICRSKAEIAERQKQDQEKTRDTQRPGATRYN